MKEVNVKVLIPDDVDPEKMIDLSLVVRYQKENDTWQFVTMPFTLTDSAEAKIKEARDTLLRLRHEVGYIRKKDIEDAFAGIVEDEK